MTSKAVLIGLGLSVAGAMLPAAAQGSYGIERGTGKVICTDDADKTPGNEDDPSYALAALWDQMFLETNACSSELTPLDNGTWGESRPVDGQDAAGLSATFKLYVLHDRYTWTLGSSTQINDNGTPVAFSEVLNTPQFFQRFCSSKAVLALGAASHEGPTLPNRQLAKARGMIVATSLANSREACAEGQVPIIYAISLGEHQNTGAGGNSSPQRRMIIVAGAEKRSHRTGRSGWFLNR